MRDESAMNHWQDYPVGATRIEAPQPDRLVRAFVRRPRACTRCSRARCGSAARKRRWCATAGVGRIPNWIRRPRASPPVCSKRGVGAGDRVALFMGNRAEFVFVLFALQRLGAIAVPIGVREARAGLAYMLNQCTAKGIVFDAESGRACAERDRSALACAAHRGRCRAGRDALGRARRRTRRRARGRGGERTRHRRHPLHLGHDRQPEGRDAHALQPRAFGAALPVVHEAAAG